MVYKKQNETLSLESTGFSGGRFIATQGSDGVIYSPTYFVTDHLGSVRALVGSDSDISERNDYYPFGYRWQTQQSEFSDNRYRYNGKEEQAFVNVPYIDYGARMYDSKIGRMHNLDQMADMYRSSSPYAYCLNNPANAIDPDGNLVIFINGFTINPFEKGTERYWQTTVNGTKRNFSEEVQDHFNDHNTMYRHGGVSLTPRSRMNLGALQAIEDFSQIIDKISTDGAITETIKIITHSMGAAFGKGYVKMLRKLFKKYNYSRALISLVADFDPYQAGSLSVESGVHTMQFTHKGKIADKRQKNLDDENYYEDSSKTNHSIYSFFNDISNLEEGTYYWNGYTWELMK